MVHISRRMNVRFLVVTMKSDCSTTVVKIIDVIHLRELVCDYVAYHLNISSQNGVPIRRTMFYDFDREMESYQSKDQYMFGTDYLVTPVYTYQTTSRSIYLPEADQQNATQQHYYSD